MVSMLFGLFTLIVHGRWYMVFDQESIPGYLPCGRRMSLSVNCASLASLRHTPISYATRAHTPLSYSTPQLVAPHLNELPGIWLQYITP